MHYLYDSHDTATSAAIPETITVMTPTTEQALAARVPRIGDIVHYVLDSGSNAGEIRPAIIVRTWGTTPGVAVQLQVFTDNYNDFSAGQFGCGGILWRASVPYSAESRRGTWHWPTEA